MAMLEHDEAWLDAELERIMLYFSSIAAVNETRGLGLMHTLLQIIRFSRKFYDALPLARRAMSRPGHKLHNKLFTLLEFAVRYRALWYLRTVVKQGIVLDWEETCSLLASALNLGTPIPLSSGAPKAVSLSIVRFLLDAYAPDINRPRRWVKVTGTLAHASLWVKFLSVLEDEREVLGLGHCELVELVAVMVSAGARLNDATPDCTRWMRNHLFSAEDWEYIINRQPRTVATSSS